MITLISYSIMVNLLKSFSQKNESGNFEILFQIKFETNTLFDCCKVRRLFQSLIEERITEFKKKLLPMHVPLLHNFRVFFRNILEIS